MAAEQKLITTITSESLLTKKTAQMKEKKTQSCDKCSRDWYMCSCLIHWKSKSNSNSFSCHFCGHQVIGDVFALDDFQCPQEGKECGIVAVECLPFPQHPFTCLAMHRLRTEGEALKFLTTETQRLSQFNPRGAKIPRHKLNVFVCNIIWRSKQRGWKRLWAVLLLTRGNFPPLPNTSLFPPPPKNNKEKSTDYEMSVCIPM